MFYRDIHSTKMFEFVISLAREGFSLLFHTYRAVCNIVGSCVNFSGKVRKVRLNYFVR